MLPVPWLPIKKGQSLNRHRDTGDDGSPAVVLTLRKKFSIVKRPQSQHSDASGTSGAPSGSNTNGASEQPTGVEPSDRSVLDRNPWEEEQAAARPRPRTHRSTHSGQIHRRLSFDAASGVIVLPEDENWLEAEDSDSDDYGELQNSTLSVPPGGDREGSEQTSAGGSPGASKRYSTYYHHPERRKGYTRT